MLEQTLRQVVQPKTLIVETPTFIFPRSTTKSFLRTTTNILPMSALSSHLASTTMYGASQLPRVGTAQTSTTQALTTGFGTSPRVGTTTMRKTTQIPRTINPGRQLFTEPPPTPTIIVPRTPTGGGGIVAPWWFPRGWPKAGTKQAKIIRRQPKRYQPSLAAIGLKIRVPKKKIKMRGVLSGLGIRPIPI